MAVARLLAITPDGREHRFELEDGQHLVGRAGEGDPPGKVAIKGDPSLSRAHFTLEVGPIWRILPCPQARNRLEFEGELPAGASFRAGRTLFRREGGLEPRCLTLMPGSRRARREARANACLEALTRFLPLLRQATDSQELLLDTVHLLKDLLPEATHVAALGNPSLGDAVRPSRRLLSQVAESGQSLLYQWVGNDHYTQVDGCGWALASPVFEGRILYAQGKAGGDCPGQQEQVLVDLVAEALTNHLQARRLAQLGRFLSPSLRRLPDLEHLLAPRVGPVTVLFFDLRGSSRAAEANDLVGYHQTLNQVMTEVTGCVFAEEGTVIDYVGDGLMACWGAPFAQAVQAPRAARAALAILERVRQLGHDCGLGLASGRALAGQVGAADQVKYGLVGPVANQAARLEGMTKLFDAPILLEANCRSQLELACRHLATVVPVGMDEAVEVHALVEPTRPQALEAALARLGVSGPDEIVKLGSKR